MLQGCPTENGCESEKHECCGEEVWGNDGSAGDNCKSAGERFHRDVHAFESELWIPGSRDDNGKTGHCANDNRVEECARHADEALTYGFLGFCGCGGNRSGA